MMWVESRWVVVPLWLLLPGNHVDRHVLEASPSRASLNLAWLWNLADVAVYVGGQIRRWVVYVERVTRRKVPSGSSYSPAAVHEVITRFERLSDPGTARASFKATVLQRHGPIRNIRNIAIAFQPTCLPSTTLSITN